MRTSIYKVAGILTRLLLGTWYLALILLFKRPEMFKTFITSYFSLLVAICVTLSIICGCEIVFKPENIHIYTWGGITAGLVGIIIFVMYTSSSTFIFMAGYVAVGIAIFLYIIWWIPWILEICRECRSRNKTCYEKT